MRLDQAETRIDRDRAGRKDMKRIYAASAIAAFVLGSAAWMAPASAAPPTVTPSPGYDARLQEQRAAQTYRAPVYEPVVRYHRPAHRHHVEQHDGAH
jgi:hypothetical protein